MDFTSIKKAKLQWGQWANNVIGVCMPKHRVTPVTPTTAASLHPCSARHAAATQTATAEVTSALSVALGGGGLVIKLSVFSLNRNRRMET